MIKRIACLATLFLIFSCKKSSDFNSDVNLFKDHIINFTSGINSVKTDFRVVLAKNLNDWQANQTLDNDLFTISPSVKGKVVALSGNTVAFVPNEKLKQDTDYQVTFHLSKVRDVKSELKNFNFTVKTIKQNFSIETLDLQSYSKTFQYLNGVLTSSDVLTIEEAHSLVEALQNGKNLKVKFSPSTGNNQFPFVIDSIKRDIDDSQINIKWQGKKLDIDQKGEMIFEIPGQNNFKVVSAEIANDNPNCLFINFSDPVKSNQNFSGLVQIESANRLRFATAGNLLKVFFDENLKGEQMVEVFQGIQNEDNFKLKLPFAQKVVFNQPKPEIKFVKSGVILPSSNQLRINFEAINLSAIDVKVYKIYQNNVLQFLQDNEINGKTQLRKVAQPIAKQKITLKTDNLKDLTKWKAYALDLSKIIEVDPGAIYRVELSFKPKYSLYKCSNPFEDIEEEEDEKDEVRTNEYYWDDYEDNYYNYDYNWNERDNPCSSSYYYGKSLSTNVIASDLGAIVKRGENGSYVVAVSNIVTAKPESGVKVEFYNFQQQPLGSANTDSDGLVKIDLEKYAFFAIITKGKNTTYVKLDENQSLSVSNFNVGGDKLQKGLKGFIYGERGVWRPGDTIYLSFMLNDVESKLANNHPIKLRISDPQGKLRFQSNQKYNDLNHYRFVVATNPNDLTGNWEAKISVGGAHFYKALKIETIKPNRLKIKNGFADKQLSGHQTNTATVDVAWLHGAIAKNLKIDMQAKFMAQSTTFKNYENFDFDDEVRKFYTEEVNLYAGQINENGQATVNIQPKVDAQTPGKLKLVIQTRAFETGGDFSTDVATATYSPFKTYVGIKAPPTNKYGMLETGKSLRYDIVTVNENGQPKAVNNLKVSVFKLDYRWWWGSGENDLSRYQYASSTTAYKNFIVNTSDNGKTSIQFTIPNQDWGNYLIRVEDPTDKHATSLTSFMDSPYWSSQSKNTGDFANVLVFSADKTNYQVGDKAKLSFPSSEEGKALISIENGSKVLKTFWVDTQKGETNASFDIESAMAPNAYVHITMLKPHASTLNDAPIRMYGIINLDIEDKNTRLQPKIQMPDVLRPEQSTTVKVSESSGKAMTYTLAIVDDGLLDLTRFKTPDPWKNFYKKQSLGVKTWDVYDDIIGAYGGKINQVFSIGGDEDVAAGGAKKANRFKPVVIHLGPFKLNKGETKSHQIKIPNYIGSVRAMVVAGDAPNSAYGHAEKTVTVRKPLMVNASVPRKISSKEKIIIPVNVFAMENHIKNVTVQLKTGAGVSITSAASQQVNFSSPDEKTIFFEVEVGNTTGITNFEVIATSGSEKASYQVEVDITNPNPLTTEYIDVVLAANSSQTINWETFGMAGSNQARLELATMPTINFHGRLQYLIHYPHGCLEQTTSGALPQLFITDLVDMTDAKKSDIQRNINAAIERIGSMQLSNGGFSYWSGQSSADDWSSSYAGHFLILAEKKGFVLPGNFKNKWISYQQDQSKKWRLNEAYKNDLAQAYRLYTLALAGSPDLASMNRLRETANISSETKIRLATAYALAGQKTVAQQLLNQPVAANANYYQHYYGSEERNRAMLLETYLSMGNKTKAFEMAKQVAQDLSSERYMSTQSTAYALYAMAKFATQNGEKGIKVTLKTSNKSSEINSNKAIFDQALSMKTGANSITLTNKNTGNVYVRLYNSGILPIGEEKVMQNNLVANVSYTTRAGQAINLDRLPQSTELMAQVTIRNSSNERITNVALTQIIPSGFEFINLRHTDFGTSFQNKSDYIDIRDDRTHFYFNLNAGESRTFTMLINTTYLGKYYLPGIQCEAMYDNRYIARTKGRWLEIVQ